MMKYRRNYAAGGTFFFTVNLANRNQTLLVDHVDLLRLSVAHTMKIMPFHIDAWVVLPEHIHAVWTLPKGDSDYSARWKEIKKNFSRNLKFNGKVYPSLENKNENGIWQRRFWEHTIRDEVDYSNHINYVHFNPYKHGLVTRVVDWPYSSFHRAVRQGLYLPDWCSDQIDDDKGYGE